MFAFPKKTHDRQIAPSPLFKSPDSPKFRLSKSRNNPFGVHRITPIDGPAKKADRIYFACKKSRSPKDNYCEIKAFDPFSGKVISVYVQQKTKTLIEVSELFEEDSFSKAIKKSASIFQKTEPKKNIFYPVPEDPLKDHPLKVCQTDRWKLYTEFEGGFQKAFVASDKTVKFGHNESEYLSDRIQLQNIYAKIGSKNIGIQDPPLERIEQSALYNNRRNKATALPAHHTEISYQGTLLDIVCKGSLSKDVLYSVCACLVQGSKKFLEENIFFLDAKLPNTGYLGNGIAEHFDFANAVAPDISTSASYALTSSIILKKDAAELRKSFEKPLLRQIHIFELGIIFYGLAARGNSPYTPEEHEAGKGITSLLPASSLQKDLKANYNQEQTSIILQMLSIQREDRPDIEEIEKAFPKELILNASYKKDS